MALMAVADALQRVLADARPLPAETVALDEALGRVLTDDVVALRTQPPAALSAMDGYAVRASDVARAPVTLRVIGEVAAGHPFAGKVGPGEAARIFTGGVMPAGSDTVVIQEFTKHDADRVTINRITDKGRQVVRQIMGVTNELRREVLQDVDREELRITNKVLSQILRRLETLTNGDAARKAQNGRAQAIPTGRGRSS